jgi:hypothetical protein
MKRAFGISCGRLFSVKIEKVHQNVIVEATFMFSGSSKVGDSKTVPPAWFINLVGKSFILLPPIF